MNNKNNDFEFNIGEMISQETEAAYISYKERQKLKPEHYLDPVRKSFPIRPGHECTDLEAALRSWGRYKGNMSHDAFKAKVMRLLKEHSCPIPKSWQDSGK
jgi:hypothetical protein